MKLYLGLTWRIFHILTREDIDDVISRFKTVVCTKYSCLCNKKKITRWLEDMNFVFEW